MSNEPLFNKIKSELDNYQPAYDQADWEKMEQMLDRKKRIFPIWAMRAAASITILVGLGTAVYFGFLRPENELETNQFATVTFDLDFSSKSFNKNANSPSSDTEYIEASSKNDQLLAANQSSTSNDAKSSTEAIDFKNNTRYAEKEQVEVARTEATEVAQQKILKDGKQQLDAKEEPKLGPADKLNRMQFPSVDEFALQSHPSLNEIFDDKYDEHHSKPQKAKWWAGASAKPSLQVVSNSKGAFGQGIVAGVDFSNSLGIETGLFYEQMRYDENPETGLMLDASHVSTQGNYSGISIPVKFNYRFNKGRAIQPTIHAGLTAFIPTKEEYVFSYDRTNSFGTTGNPSNLSAEVSRDTLRINHSAAGRKAESFDVQTFGNRNYESIQGNSKNSYLMASVGGGVRYYLNSRLSFQVSANFVQPLSEIGIEGRNIRQFDFGLAMQYQIN